MPAGPWNEGATYSETFTFGPDPSDSLYWRVVNAISPDPGTPWQGAGGLIIDRTSGSSGYGVDGTTSFEADYGSDSVSQSAWASMLSAGGGNNGGAPRIEYQGAFGYPILPAGTGHQESWKGLSYEVGSNFYTRTGTNWGVLAGAGPTPDGAYGIEFEESGSATISRAISLDVSFSLGGDSRWHLFVVGPHGDGPPYEAVVDAGYRLDSNSSILFETPAGTDLGNGGSYSFDVAPLNNWKTEYDAAGGLYFIDASRLPKLNVVWTGGWPGDTLGPDFNYDLPSAQIVLTYTWKVSRWRWLFSTIDYGRLKLDIDGVWKYADPAPGENGGFGVLKVSDGLSWQPARSRLKIPTSEGWKPA